MIRISSDHENSLYEAVSVQYFRHADVLMTDVCLQMFLLTACLDMTVYVHSFTTGSPLHTLKTHQSQVNILVNACMA